VDPHVEHRIASFLEAPGVICMWDDRNLEKPVSLFWHWNFNE